MVEGRREKREAARFQVQLCDLADQLVAELASTQNISVHGVRVETERPWKPTTRLLVKSSRRELWALAQIVYCQTLQPRALALGLEFLAWTGGWLTRRPTELSPRVQGQRAA
jgi:hypothetical protein